MIRDHYHVFIGVNEAPVSKVEFCLIEQLEKPGRFLLRHQRLCANLSLHSAVHIRAILHGNEVICEQRQVCFAAPD